MTARDSMTWDEQWKAKRRVMSWVILQGYVGMGAALMSGVAFGVWHGSLMAGLWMACVLIGLPISLGAAVAMAFVMSRVLAASHTPRDD
jgi:hypothetical protein